MPDIHEMDQMPVQTVNGKSEAERLSLLVQQLQAECERLRTALARAEEDRDIYLGAVYAYERANIDFDDVDIDELRKNSAGPVELME